MISPEYLIAFIAVMAAATILTRAGAFFLPKKWTDHRIVKKISQILPMAILTLLVMYTVKDTPVLTRPYGIPAAAALGAVIVIHLWKRNALLSIIAGTGLYMGLNAIFAVV